MDFRTKFLPSKSKIHFPRPRSSVTHFCLHAKHLFVCPRYAAARAISTLGFPSRHVHLSVLRRASSLRRPPTTLYPLPSCSPHVQPRSLQPCVHVNAEGMEAHVCAMRTGIGVSLFRGGSDVLFHPRRRQSCRTAKTYHTIVSKFAHLLISRSFLSVVSLFPLLLFSLSLSPFTVAFRRFFFISLLIFSHFISSLSLSLATSLFSFSLRLPPLHRLLPLFIVAILSPVYPVSRGGASWYAPAKFSAVPFARRTGRHRMKCASCRLRLPE